jgi:3-oxoacyl-[acyl-carrier-protein] synthase-3
MAVAAAQKLFDGGVDKQTVDYILFCTQSPDYDLPASACIIQNRLGLPKSVGALDFNQGCSGYIYGLSLAKGLIVAGIARNVLLLTAETYTKRLHPQDKGNRTLFGDAASATLISTEGFAQIGAFSLGTDGSGAENLIVATGGARHPRPSGQVVFDADNNPVSPDYIYMNGSEIFTFGLTVVPTLVGDTLARNGLDAGSVDLYIFHQANRFMLDFLRKKLKIAENQFYIYLSEVGNTVSSTLPIAIYEAKKENRLQGAVLLAGFGVGYSWGGVMLWV